MTASSLCHPFQSPPVIRNASIAANVLRICGTGPPGVALRDSHAQLHRESRELTLKPRKADGANEIVVDTYMHVVTTVGEAPGYTPERIANLVSKQAGVLNTAYASSNISFNLKPYSYTINDAWATDSADSAMKSALRKGSYSALNIYFQSNLSAGVATPGAQASQLLGYCTLPQTVTYTPSSCTPDAQLPNGNCAPVAYSSDSYAQDGCNVLAGSMPDGGLAGYQEGKTAVHEVGHWFGLLHTFQDNTCAAGDPGDYVDDTPQESVSTDGCPPLNGVVKDSCPGNGGQDPVHNYMDYSNDAW
ncbi:MAG: hypothetical protein Q9191_002648 [Dirinaria sp. TL-2023a]